MGEKDELTGLFRKRLKGSEMPVRDGFWEELSADLSSVAGTSVPERRLSLPFARYRRVAVAASAALLLGVASAAWWYLAFRVDREGPDMAQVATTIPQGRLDGDRLQELLPAVEPLAPAGHLSGQSPEELEEKVTDAGEEESGFSVRVSVTITRHVAVTRHREGGRAYGQRVGQAYEPLYGTAYGQGLRDVRKVDGDSVSACDASLDENVDFLASRVPNVPARKWALKAGVGTSLPKGDFHMPLTASLTAERRFGRCLSLEAGLQYSYMPIDSSVGDDVHELAIPARLNLLLAEKSKVDVYAQLGGAAGLTMGKGCGEESVRLSAMTGLGVRYKVNERLAFFAEPSVSHHFSTDSDRRTLRSERPVNFNLLCGVRMAY